MSAPLDLSSQFVNWRQACQFIVAPSGSGKTVQATGQAIHHVLAGRRVLILDCGRGYLAAANALGGTYFTIQPDGSLHTLLAGGVRDTQLTVFDIEPCAQALADCPNWPGKLSQGEAAPDLVIVDEVFQLHPRCLWLREQLGTWMAGGASLCLVGQREADVGAFRSLLRDRSVRETNLHLTWGPLSGVPR